MQTQRDAVMNEKGAGDGQWSLGGLVELTDLFVRNKVRLSPGRVAQLVGVLSCTSKGCGFDFWWGNLWKAANWCFSLTSMFFLGWGLKKVGLVYSPNWRHRGTCYHLHIYVSMYLCIYLSVIYLSFLPFSLFQSNQRLTFCSPFGTTSSYWMKGRGKTALALSTFDLRALND